MWHWAVYTYVLWQLHKVKYIVGGQCGQRSINWYALYHCTQRSSKRHLKVGKCVGLLDVLGKLYNANISILLHAYYGKVIWRFCWLTVQIQISSYVTYKRFSKENVSYLWMLLRLTLIHLSHRIRRSTLLLTVLTRLASHPSENGIIERYVYMYAPSNSIAV